MFKKFHAHLKVIERDSICQCGACQTASNLTLKFVVHYGPIKEITISRFTKASGLDMIVAHRLLKNSIPSSEYILITQRYLDAQNEAPSDADLRWQSASETYPVIGRIDFKYALLDHIKSSVAEPPPRQELAYTIADDTIGIDIDAPMLDVYQLLIDLENRVQWLPGLRSGESEIPIDRVGAKHVCIFDDETYEVMPIESDIQDQEIRYVEASTGLTSGLTYPVECLLKKENETCTHLVMKIGEEKGHPLAPEVMEMIVHEWRHIAESFKAFCERGTP